MGKYGIYYTCGRKTCEGGATYPVSYAYDAYGNRVTSSECGTNATYLANCQDQYTDIEYTTVQPSTPRIASPSEFASYLCIQRLNGANNAVTDLFEWDPTEPVATRPLYWQQRTAAGNYSFFYAHDGNKNASEVVSYQSASGIAAHYEYAPFGAVTAATGTRAADNPYRFSSEFSDDTLGLVYYNYRHYEPMMGRWLQRDPIGEAGGRNVYLLNSNQMVGLTDCIGLQSCDEVKMQFDSWYQDELKRLDVRDENGKNWVDRLKPCPPNLNCHCETFAYAYPGELAGAVHEGSRTVCESPDSTEWSLSYYAFAVVQVLGSYHPGGTYELRTKYPSKYGGNGNQCIYDDNGILLRDVPSAGTADLNSPSNLLAFLDHQKNDIVPFDWARKLDSECGGNGTYVEKYYQVRPSK